MEFVKKHWYLTLGWIAILMAMLLQPHTLSAKSITLESGSIQGQGSYPTQQTAWNDGGRSNVACTVTGGSDATLGWNGSTNSYYQCNKFAMRVTGSASTTYDEGTLTITIKTDNADDPLSVGVYQIYENASFGNGTQDYSVTARKVSNSVSIHTKAQYDTATFNISGNIYTNASGYAYLAIIADNDQSNTIPASGWGSNYMWVYGTGNATYKPVIDLEEYQPPGAPLPPSDLSASVVYYEAFNIYSLEVEFTDNSIDESGFEFQVAADSEYSSVFLSALSGGLSGTGTASWGHPNIDRYGQATIYVRVRAYNAFGNSAWVTGSTTTGLPAAPSNLAAAIAVLGQTNVVNLTWDDNANNETGFVVERAYDVNFTESKQTYTINTQNTESYQDTTNWNSSETLYYRVKAVNSVGSSAWSGVDTANVDTAIPPPTTQTGTADWIGSLPWAGEPWFPYATMFILMMTAFGIALYLSRDRKIGVIFGGVGAMVVMGIFITLNWINGLIIMALAIAVAVIFLLPKVVGR